MKKKIKYKSLLFFIPLTVLIFGCSVKYSFRSTNLSPDIKSITVNTVENRAMKVNPSLSNNLTNALQDKYRKLTKLEMLPDGGDLEVSGYIERYDINPTAVTADEIASMNRLTITVKIIFTNNKDKSADFERSFVAYQDYDSNLNLDAVEAQLCDQIIETLVEDIFNATVANW